MAQKHYAPPGHGGRLQVDAERRDFTSELRDTLRVLRSQGWLILLCVVVAAAAGYAYSQTQDDEFESHARVQVVLTNPAASLGAGQPFVDPARERATAIELVRSPTVARRVVAALKLRSSPGEVLSRVNATASGDSNLIDITVRDSRPRRAAALANAFAEQFVAYRRENDRRRYRAALAGVRARANELRGANGRQAELRRLRDEASQLALLARLQTGGTQVVERAAGPGAKVQSNTSRNTAIAALIGLLIGLALAFVRDRLDPRLQNEDAVRALAPGIPILASIPSSGRRSRWIAGEGFHNLQVTVDALSDDGHARSLLVTGTMPDEGKSTTAANLAAAMAGKRRNVTLIEADLRRPGLSHSLGVNGQPGVSSVLEGKAQLTEVTGRATVTPGGRRRGPQLYLPGEFGFVPAGPVPDDPRSIIDERGLAELVDSAGAHADTVIVDAPPIGMFSDVLPLAQRVGGVVVAVRLHHTRRAALERLLDRLATASIRPIGIVVLGARQENAGYGHYAGG